MWRSSPARATTRSPPGCGTNPFLATELLRWPNGRKGDGHRRPVRVLGFVRERLAALPAGAERVLATAASAGVEFDPRLVVARASARPAEARRALAAAQAAGLIVPARDRPDRLVFRHGVVHSILLETLDPAPRRLNPLSSTPQAMSIEGSLRHTG